MAASSHSSSDHDPQLYVEGAAASAADVAAARARGGAEVAPACSWAPAATLVWARLLLVHWARVGRLISGRGDRLIAACRRQVRLPSAGQPLLGVAISGQGERAGCGARAARWPHRAAWRTPRGLKPQLAASPCTPGPPAHPLHVRAAGAAGVAASNGTFWVPALGQRAAGAPACPAPAQDAFRGSSSSAGVQQKVRWAALHSPASPRRRWRARCWRAACSQATGRPRGGCRAARQVVGGCLGAGGAGATRAAHALLRRRYCSIPGRRGQRQRQQRRRRGGNENTTHLCELPCGVVDVT